jgi:class 3 adenylate cyclase
MIQAELMQQIELLEQLAKQDDTCQQGQSLALALLEERSLIRNAEQYVHVLQILAHTLYRMGQYEQALSWADKACEHINDLTNKSIAADAYSTRANIKTVLFAYSESLEDYKISNKYCTEALESRKMAHNYAAMGNIYRLMADYHSAMESLEIALDLSDKYDIQKTKSYALCKIAHVHYSTGNYKSALDYYADGIEIAEKYNEISIQVESISAIGRIFNNLNEKELSLEYYQKALNLANQHKLYIYSAENLRLIANIYQGNELYELALEYYNKCLDICESIQYKGIMSDILNDIGTVYADMEQYDLALEYMHKALYLEEKTGRKHQMAVIVGCIGYIYSDTKFPEYNLVKAEEYYLHGLMLLENIDMKRLKLNFYKSLADIYEQLQRWQEYSFHLKNYYETEKSVLSIEARKQADKLEYERKTAEREKQIAVERAVTAARIDEQQNLIHNILPPIIADRLLKNETFIADNYSGVSVLFMDLVNFTQLSGRIPPRQLIYLLNTIFSRADKVMERFGLEKIKTIGDAYMAVAGAPISVSDHASRAANAALALLEEMNNLSITIPDELGSSDWARDLGQINVRIGLHCGDAIGGVIGDKKFSFDLWGDAVNTASRMESHGEPGRIHVSEEFAQKLRENLGENLTLRQAQYTAQTLSPGESFYFPFGEGRDGVSFSFPFGEGRDGVSFSFPLGEGRDGVLIPRGEIEIKGKGPMHTYFLERV